MKKILLAMLAIAGFVFATSCSDDDNDDVMLTIKEKVVEFEKDAAEKTVAVVTDAEKWSAIGSAEWIDVKPEGSNLVIKVAENETVYDRKGKVLVVAGNANATIDVTQKGTKGSAIVVPENISVEDAKGQIAVEVNANDKKWTATSDVDWLRVTAKPYKAELVLDYDRNTELEDRMAVVTINVGGDKIMVDVKQLGRMFFLLPYGDLVNGNREQVLAFEEGRKNKLDEERSDEKQAVFKTRSTDIFPGITYVFTKEARIKQCVVSVKEAKILRENLDGFKEYLIANGYEAETDLIFANEKLGVRAFINFISFWGMEFADVTYKPIPVQDKDYPTFTKFPYGFTEWRAMKDKIDIYETEEGGVFNESESTINDPNRANDFLWYDVKKDKQGEAETTIRAYFVAKADQPEPGLVETVQVMKKTTMAFFVFNGEPVLTKEFKELCKKEGFVYKGFDGNWHIFENATKKLGAAIRHVTFTGDDTPSIQLNMYEVSGEGGSFRTPSYYPGKDDENEVPRLTDSAR